MPSNIQLSSAAAEAMAQAFCDALNAAAPAQPGKLKLYSGAQPSDGDDAIGGGNTLLATLRFSDPPEVSVTGGVITFDVMTADSSADASGTATWFRMTDGADVQLLDGSVGTSGADLNMPSVSIVALANVSISSGTLTLLRGT